MGKARDFFEIVIPAHDSDDCLLWPYANIKGYAAMRVNGETVYVSRLICPGEPGPGRNIAAHTCGRGASGCVNKRHIEWKTQKENKDDELTHGTRNFGRRNGRVKLVEDEVLRIVRMRGVLTYKEIGSLFGVSHGAVKDIMGGHNWGWLTGIKRRPRKRS